MMNSSAQNSYDVAIVGASFAGLYLASILPKHLRVYLIEKNSDFSKLETTGSTLIDGESDIFNKFNIPAELIINKYSKFAVSTSGGKNYSISFKKPIWALLDIQKLKEHLQNRLGENVALFFGCSAKNIIENKNSFTQLVCEDADGKEICFSAKIFVDATGSSALLMRQAHLKMPSSVSKCGQIDTAVANRSSDTIELFFGYDFCPGGYAYIFPMCKDRIRIGACGVDDYAKSDDNGLILLDKFLRHVNIKPAEDSNQLRIEIFTGGKTFGHKKNLIAVGDSAGTISPILGEGIRFAFHSSVLTNELINEFLAGSYQAFEEIPRRWRAIFGRKFDTAYLIQVILGKLGQKSIKKFAKNLAIAGERNPDLFLRVISTNFTLRDIFKILVV